MHPLFQTTRRTPVSPEGLRPQDADYDFAEGVWRDAKGPLSDDDERIPRTKKADLETGEDQKGQ